MAYLIEHTDDCLCTPHNDVVCATPYDVSLYLWGRPVDAHIVYAGECPFRFFTSDIRLIAALLEDCPVSQIRPYLPCAFWAGSTPLVAVGECQMQRDGTIQGFREISYMQWLKEMYPMPSQGGSP